MGRSSSRLAVVSLSGLVALAAGEGCIQEACEESSSSLLQASRIANQTGIEFVTVFSVECKTYHDWQTVTVHKSWKDAGIPGRLVRLWACPEAKRAQSLDLSNLPGLETHVHEVAHPRYVPLNKPFGLLSWLTEGGGRELPDRAVVMIIDSDMVYHAGGKAAETLRPLVEHVHSGAALGNDYRYTVTGLHHHKMRLAHHFGVPDISNLQSIGVPILLRKDTLAKFVSAYFGITKEIVDDPVLAGMVHDGRQSAPWITEMVGYTLAAAGVRHETQEQWPELEGPQPPWSVDTETALLVHYPHTFRLCGRGFGKRLYYHTDLLNCAADVPAALQPPSRAEVFANSCTLCLEGGDAFGVPATCNLPGRAHGLFAWQRVHDAVSSWRSANCG